MYSDIITKLKARIEALDDVQACLDYEPTSLSVYPTVTVTPLGHTEEYQTLRDTRWNINIAIRVYGELSDTDETTQKTVRALVQSIVEDLNSDITLTGTVEFSMLTKAEFKFVTRDTNLFVGELTYSATQRHNRYS